MAARPVQGLERYAAHAAFGGHGSDSAVYYSVVLSTNIEGHVPSTNRIWGDGFGGGNNNHASAAILLNGQPFNDTGQHGQTISPEEIATEAFWRETMGWDLDDIWEWNEALGLPILRNVPGIQNPTAPREPPFERCGNCGGPYFPRQPTPPLNIRDAGVDDEFLSAFETVHTVTYLQLESGWYHTLAFWPDEPLHDFSCYCL